MNASNAQLKHQMKVNNALREVKKENKIIFQDSSLIQDPCIHVILQKRATIHSTKFFDNCPIFFVFQQY